METKKELNIELIKSNPSISATKLYNQSKSKGLGIRKQNFFALVREVREKPEPTIEAKEKATPIKYRIPTKVKIPSKEGQYGVVEVFDIDNEVSYWIKYKNRKDFKESLDRIKAEYNLKNFSIIYHGFRKYTSFIAKEFEAYLESEGISL